MREEIGITISVGVADNKIFAKMGSDYKKPDATTVILGDDYRAILWPLPVSDLMFAGKASVSLLGQKGIHTVGDLARQPRAGSPGRFRALSASASARCSRRTV